MRNRRFARPMSSYAAISFLLFLFMTAIASATSEHLYLAPLYSGSVSARSVSTHFSTSKMFSSNFSLVNLLDAANNLTIDYFGPDGTQWRPPETLLMPNLGSQAIRRQYEDTTLTGSEGSVVITAQGLVGGVGQIQARGQVPSSGAYSAPANGAASINIPLVMKGIQTQSGQANSQIVVQNTGSSVTTFTIALKDDTGNTVITTSPAILNAGAFFLYDVENEETLANGVYSAIVQAQSGGTVWANSSLYIGAHSLQIFSGFTQSAEMWMVPLFTSRLANGLSTPISVQNLASTKIPVGAVELDCVANPSSGGSDFKVANTREVERTTSYFFNPVIDSSIPGNWYGACTVGSAGYGTVVFVQMRFVGSDRAAAFEAFPGNGGKARAIVPIYMKRLGNGFATAVTVQNLGSAPTSVNIAYQAGDGAPASCSANVGPFTIAPYGSLIQNHRIVSGPNSVPQIPDNCYGAMVITSDTQPIHAFIQIDDLDEVTGDPFMAHNAFVID